MAAIGSTRVEGSRINSNVRVDHGGGGPRIDYQRGPDATTILLIHTVVTDHLLSHLRVFRRHRHLLIVFGVAMSQHFGVTQPADAQLDTVRVGRVAAGIGVHWSWQADSANGLGYQVLLQVDVLQSATWNLSTQMILFKDDPSLPFLFGATVGRSIGNIVGSVGAGVDASASIRLAMSADVTWRPCIMSSLGMARLSVHYFERQLAQPDAAVAITFGRFVQNEPSCSR